MGAPVDWDSEKSHTLINPRTPVCERNSVLDILTVTTLPQSHIFLLTSGSSGKKKWVALKKNAFLISAKAVNDHIQSDINDVWLNPLPLFHVGGLSIYARAFLSNADVINISESRWNPEQFVKIITSNNVTLTSLVPAQVYDIVMHSHKCPKTIRAVFVGGGALSNELYERAVVLGWPLLPTYGMTECSSQVATASMGSWNDRKYPPLLPLQHVKTCIDHECRLKISSQALLTGYITEENGLRDPKQEGWFTTEDYITLNSEGITKVFRKGDFTKIGGENVDLQQLQAVLKDACLNLHYLFPVALKITSDPRLGSCIELLAEDHDAEKLGMVINAYHQRVLPFERIKRVSHQKIQPTSWKG